MADNENETSSIMDYNLQRFLYLGTEGNIWSPKAVNYVLESIPNVSQLLKDGQASPQVIRRFHKEGCFVNSDALYFTLAVATNSRSTLGSAYLVAEDICYTSLAMLSFIHFKEKISAPKTGWGRALRRFVSHWYLEKDAKNLAVEVTKVKSAYRWTHKDVICLAHVKSKQPDTAAVLKFLMQGFEATEKEFSSVPEAQDVLTYLKAVHELKHTSDYHAAARLIEIHNFAYEHIPTKLLKSKEIWTCLIPRLKLRLLLRKLPYLHKIGLFKPNSPHLEAFLARLQEENVDDDMGPFDTFVCIRQWEASNRVLPGKPMIRQNVPQISAALLNLHMGSFKSVRTTGKRYLVAVDVRSVMVNSRTVGCSCISPADVAAVLLTALCRAETSNLTALAFSVNQLASIDINNTMSLSDVAQVMRNVPIGPVCLSAPIQWALDNKKLFDVILIITDNQTNIGEIHPANVLKDYKTCMNMPKTRFITCALGSLDFSVAPWHETDMLDIAGFHIKLLQVIQDFTCHIF